MAVLLVTERISKTFAVRPLFEDISFSLGDSDRLGLIGPNGSGKSTFLQILAGTVEPDSGQVAVRRNARLSYVPQEAMFEGESTVREVLTRAAEKAGVEASDIDARLPSVAGTAGFASLDGPAASLSGGWRKRLSIACALIAEPDVLLLDEPTNHLDLEGILWLEKLVKAAPFASVIVSHDRYFLENVATHMAELNRIYPQGMLRLEGNYSRFLERKDEFLLAEEKRYDALENKVRREVEWLRRGPKARTTKSKARIDDASRLQDELTGMRDRSAQGSAAIEFSASGRRTKKLIEAKQISKTLGGRKLFERLSVTLAPGLRIGLTGWNGSGKTTLLRILRGEMEADSGTVERADGLRLVYFDQNREQLDLKATLRRALAPEGDSVIYRDRVIHVAGWAKRFLFRADQLELPVGQLSGGERARVLIARLMLQQADVLLLDEPTNDLDIPTLEVLEDSLLEFPGALVLVTHDRYMLDRVSTSVLGLDGSGGATVYADYSQWEQAQSSRKGGAQARTPPSDPARPAATTPAKKRLSYIETREYESIEERILAAEQAVADQRVQLESASVSGDSQLARRVYDELQAAEQAVASLYERWGELEEKLK